MSRTAMDATSTEHALVPVAVRRVVYFVGVAVTALSLLVTGLASIWWPPDVAAQAVATAAVVGGVMGAVSSALGVGYVGKK